MGTRWAVGSDRQRTVGRFGGGLAVPAGSSRGHGDKQVQRQRRAALKRPRRLGGRRIAADDCGGGSCANEGEERQTASARRVDLAKALLPPSAARTSAACAERAGVAAIHIEDQVSPKRCGHLDGKEVVSRAEFVSKIRAAVAARRDPAFLIIARTDARAVIDMEEAIARVNLALGAGADMAFVEAAETVEEMAGVPKRVHGPCLLNIVPGGKTPNVSLGDAQAMGYRLAILPGAVLFEVILAADQGLHSLMRSRLPAVPPAGTTVASIFRRFGAEEWDALRRTYNTLDAV